MHAEGQPRNKDPLLVLLQSELPLKLPPGIFVDAPSSQVLSRKGSHRNCLAFVCGKAVDGERGESKDIVRHAHPLSHCQKVRLRLAFVLF